MELYRTRDAKYAEDIFFTLQSLSDAHIFFKLLFLDWSQKLKESEKDNFAHASDMLPHKDIAHSNFMRSVFKMITESIIVSMQTSGLSTDSISSCVQAFKSF